MTSSAHALVGAAIGALVGDVVAAAGLGLVSHYLLDSLPHIDYIEYNRFDRKRIWLFKFSKREIFGIVLEGILLVTLFFYLHYIPQNGKAMAVGALFAILPDFAILLRNKKGFRRVDRVHNIFEFRKNRHYYWGRRGFLACVGFEVVIAFLALRIVL